MAGRKTPDGTCGAKTKRGGLCGRPPRTGFSRCPIHGGKSPNAIAAVEREIINAQADAMAATFGLIPVGDPLMELSKLAGQLVAWKDHMMKQVVTLHDEYRYENPNGEQIRGEVQLLERAMDRAAGILIAIAKLNIDERMARVTEAQADMLVNALSAALDAAGIDPDNVLARTYAATAFGDRLQLAPTG